MAEGRTCFCSRSGDREEKGHTVLLVWSEAGEDLPLELERILVIGAILKVFCLSFTLERIKHSSESFRVDSVHRRLQERINLGVFVHLPAN